MKASRPADPAHTGIPIHPLPWLLRVANYVAAQGKAGAPKLSPENLARAAGHRADLPAHFPNHIETALEVLCRSLCDDVPQLHWFGKMNFYNLIVTGLAEYLRLEEVFRRKPELHQVKLNAPLIVTGLPRSGTTFLHRLLASVDDAQSIALYQHLYPTPRRLPTRLPEAAIQFEPWRWASRGYRIDAMHFVRPGLADECHFGMRLTLRSSLFWAMAPVTGYLNWLLEQDLKETYQVYRKALILHQLASGGKRLVLKCPHHLTTLPALCEALPEAHLIQTHRDPSETTPSECSLILSLQAISVSGMDWRTAVAHHYRKVLAAAERSVKFSYSSQGSRVFHAPYRCVVQEPVALATKIHQQFGLPLHERQIAGLKAFQAANRQHKHGKHQYSLEQFEIGQDAIDLDFRAYRERFLTV